MYMPTQFFNVYGYPYTEKLLEIKKKPQLSKTKYNIPFMSLYQFKK